MTKSGYRYTGQGERYRGVPARDLTQQEYDNLDPRAKRTVTNSGAYELVPLTDLSMDDLRAMAIEGGSDADAVGKLRSKADVIKEIEAAAKAVAPQDPAGSTPPDPNNEGDGGK